MRQKLVEGEGFEPSKAEPSDLQSDPVDRLGIPPGDKPRTIEPIQRDVKHDCTLIARHAIALLLMFPASRHRHPPMPHPAIERRRIPSWLAALAAQLAGCGLAVALAFAGTPGAPWSLLAAQAIGAAATSQLMRREYWWPLIHLCFAPLVAATLATDVDPRWYLGAFILLLLTFWGTLGTRVPLYLSGSDAVDAVETLLPPRRPLKVLDIGCGTAALLAPLARRQPDVLFFGRESAPLPWAIARMSTYGQRNLHIARGDFFRIDWSGYDVVYAFLSPHPMPQVTDKARRELHPQAMLISKDFPAPELTPVRTIDLPGGGTLYCYQPGARPAGTD